MTRTTAPRGLTLVEILVVVGVLGILIAILIPTLSLARARANRTTCAFAMRTIGQGFALYAVDYGVWPVTDWEAGTYHRRWYDQISKLIGPETNADGQHGGDWKSILRPGRDPLLGCPVFDARSTPGYAMNASFSAETTFASGNLLSGGHVPLAAITPFTPGVFSHPAQWTHAERRCLVGESISGSINASFPWPWWEGGELPMPNVPDDNVFSFDFNRHRAQGKRATPGMLTMNLLYADLHVDFVSALEAHRAVSFQRRAP